MTVWWMHQCTIPGLDYMHISPQMLAWLKMYYSIWWEGRLLLHTSMQVTVCGCGFAPMDTLKHIPEWEWGSQGVYIYTLESEGHRVFIYTWERGYTLHRGVELHSEICISTMLFQKKSLFFSRPLSLSCKHVCFCINHDVTSPYCWTQPLCLSCLTCTKNEMLVAAAPLHHTKLELRDCRHKNSTSTLHSISTQKIFCLWESSFNT